MKGKTPDENDGRVLRGARNQERIVQALYDLVREGNVHPTAEEVAARAGVGTRTVFRQFEDFESLYRILGERIHTEVLRIADFSPPDGGLKEAMEAVVHRRGRVFEHLAPFRRAARTVRHTSAFLREQDDVLGRELRERLVVVLVAYVGRPDPDTLEALDLVLSFEAWDRLRDEQRLSVKQTERVLSHAAFTLAAAARQPESR